jgi:hypothetical protein
LSICAFFRAPLSGDSTVLKRTGFNTPMTGEIMPAFSTREIVETTPDSNHLAVFLASWCSALPRDWNELAWPKAYQRC